MIILYVILTLIITLLTVILIRTVMFVPVKTTVQAENIYNIDEQKICDNFCDMIRCKTISSPDDAERDDAEFVKFRALLKERYPNVTAHCERKRFDTTAVLYRWRGKSDQKPTVLMSHYDVVPVDRAQWDKEPFAGDMHSGVIWGRGTLDTKATLCGVMEAAEKLIGDGFVPENDIYLAFSGDEEIAGSGQPTVVEYFKQQNIKPALVLDEGGAVVQGKFPGVTKKIAFVGITEKGQMNVRLTVKSKGGHASSPPRKTPIATLAKAVTAVDTHPFPFTLSEATAAMFDTLGRHSNFAYRMIFANLWLFSPLLDKLASKSGGQFNALLRTTCAFTVMQGSSANNVIPPVASVGANIRIISGETVDSVMAHLKNTINDDDIELSLINGGNPCKTSKASGAGWDRVTESITECWPDAATSPYLMYAASDSRHYAEICDSVYRFSVIEMTAEQLDTIHGHNEHITVSQLTKIVQFYLSLIAKC